MTKADLLEAGWHNICDKNGSWWTIPTMPGCPMLNFQQAVEIEKAWRKTSPPKENMGETT